MGKISELINQMIERALTSAVIISPRFTDYRVAEVLVREDPDFEREIEEIIKNQEKTVKKPTASSDEKVESDKTKKQLGEAERKLDDILTSNLGDIKKMSAEQFANVKLLATNPFSFITTTILRKLKTGAGILFIVAIAVEVAKFLILELFKPGRPFDIRFREEINAQVIQFLDRKQQQELRQGYKSLITTTIGGLRGNALRNQIGGNFYNFDRLDNTYDPSFVRASNDAARDARVRSSGPGGSLNPRAGRGK